MKRPASFWQTEILFYLDGVGWAHKNNPKDHAKTLRTRTWRQKKEGRKKGCTAKGKKEGVGGKMVYFMVAVAYGKGVVAAMPYTGPINGAKFSQLVDANFPKILKKFRHYKSRYFMQDGDRSQNAKQSLSAISRSGLEIFPITPRSPDFNPIENIFHLISVQIKQDGLKLDIERETYEEFQTRCFQTMMNFPKDIIDKTIDSMPDRMRAAIKDKGGRTKY